MAIHLKGCYQISTHSYGFKEECIFYVSVIFYLTCAEIPNRSHSYYGTSTMALAIAPAAASVTATAANVAVTMDDIALIK